MTYLGGSTVDEAYGVAVNSAGESFVTGETDSTDFAGRSNGAIGHLDVFVAKISAAGAQQWALGLGGTQDDVGVTLPDFELVLLRGTSQPAVSTTIGQLL
jgi:hypothetical protein